MAKLGTVMLLVSVTITATAKDVAAPPPVIAPASLKPVFDGEMLGWQPTSDVDGLDQKLDPLSIELVQPPHPESPGDYELLAHINERLLADCGRPQYLQGVHPDGSPAFNRFAWWFKQAPPTGPMTLNGSSQITFECEFFYGLTTLTGAALSIGSGVNNLERLGYDTQPWDLRDENGNYVINSIHDLPRLGFAVRTRAPDSVPRFETVTLPGGVERRVLVNRLTDGQTLAPGQFRAPLVFDFAFPQRAVGLEYGFVQVPDPGDVPFASVELFAFDDDGKLVASSNGDFLAQGGNDAEPTTLTNRIAVQDREGRIVSVELHFGDQDPRGDGPPIREPQAVLRIWHAPLPPAAVLQASMAIGTPPAVEDGQRPAPVGAATHSLPFGHDRAVAFLRGMGWRFTDNRPHKVARFKARTESTVHKFSSGYQIIVEPSASMLPSADNSGLRNDSVLHYSVLSWNSHDSELFTAPMDGFVEDANENHVSGTWQSSDPCLVSVLSTSSDPDIYRSEAESRCGQMFAAVNDMALSSGSGFNDQEFDVIELLFGTYDRWLDHSMGWALGPNASIFDDDRRLAWSNSATLDGDGRDDIAMRLGAVAITGRSLHTGPDPMPEAEVQRWLGTTFYFPIPNVSTRPPKGDNDYWTWTWDELRDAQMSWPMRADVAAVGLRRFYAQPNDGLRELEFEVIGAHYDGRIVNWQMAMGVGAGNAISGGLGGGQQRLADANPHFAGVTRRSRFGVPELETVVDLRCEAVIDLGAQGCDGWAVVRNVGDHQALITEVAPGTHPEDGRFRHTFYWRGERIYDLDALHGRLPLQLRPGEDLLVGAFYTPEDPGDGRTRWVDTGFLSLRTDTSAINASVASTGIGLASDANGLWSPGSLVFEPVVANGTSSAQVAVLQSTGTTPLTITWAATSGGLYFADASLGFSVTPAPNQPEPGVFAVVVDYNPQAGSFYDAETTLIAETNAGPIRVPVRARLFTGVGGT